MRTLSNQFLFIMGVLAVTLQGCADLHPRNSTSMDLGSILIPVKDSLAAEDKKPLRFPTIVAVLMVPGTYAGQVPSSTLRLAAEALKKELLKNEKYVSGVQIVSPEDTQGRLALSTIRDLYGADIVAVLSYVQDQRRKQNPFLAFLDVTILPQYVVPGVKATTTTVVDGKIIHIPSNAIIFRASGMDERDGYMTSHTSNRDQADEDTVEAFIAATENLGLNVSKKLADLDEFDMSQAVSMNTLIEGDTGTQLADSQGNPRDPNDQWGKVDSFKSSGGGASGVVELLLLGGMALSWLARSRPVNRWNSVVPKI